MKNRILQAHENGWNPVEETGLVEKLKQYSSALKTKFRIYMAELGEFQQKTREWYRW